MPGFMELKSGDWTIKAIFASVFLVIVGGVFTIYHEIKGEGTGPVEYDIMLKCNNPDCDYVATVSNQDYEKMRADRDQQWQQEFKQNNPPGTPLPGVMDMMMTPEEMGPGAIIGQWGKPGWPLICPKCGQQTVFEAMQCKKCEKIFYPFNQQGQWDDTCHDPSCGYSDLDFRRQEAKRKKQAEEK